MLRSSLNTTVLFRRHCCRLASLSLSCLLYDGAYYILTTIYLHSPCSECSAVHFCIPRSSNVQERWFLYYCFTGTETRARNRGAIWKGDHAVQVLSAHPGFPAVPYIGRTNAAGESSGWPRSCAEWLVVRQRYRRIVGLWRHRRGIRRDSRGTFIASTCCMVWG